MATSPNTAATNGHGNSGTTKLDRLLAFHESAAAAIRMTIGLMNGQAQHAKTNGHASVLAEAIALDGARRTKTKKKQLRNGERKAAKRAQREQTERTLAAFTASKPRQLADVAAEVGVSVQQIAVGPLLRAKYLKRKRGGFVRTTKPYVVDGAATVG
jgi:hypothetical protein